MLKCELCKQFFHTNQSLVSHLTNPTSKCKINIKNYYDKFLRKKDEGICIYCNSETSFYGLKKGYMNNICQTCNLKNIDSNKNLKRSKSLKLTLKNKREKKDAISCLINLIRKQTIDINNKNQCQICGLIFKSIDSLTKHLKIHNVKLKEYYDMYFKSKNEDVCLCYNEIKECKKSTRFISLKDGYGSYCSTKCSSLSPLIYIEKQNNSIKNYGVIHPTKDPEINKNRILGIRKTINERNSEIIEKRKNTCIKKYGVDSVNKVKEIRDKQKVSFNEFKNSNRYELSRKIQYDKYLENIFYPRMNKVLELQKLELIQEYNGAHLSHKFKCKICGSVFDHLWNSVQQGILCKVCNKGKSKPEIEINTWLKNYNVDFIENNRNQIPPYELDMFMESKKIAIEYCGLYYHSELVNIKNPESYHNDKLNLCLKNNINLIQIFEDEWLFKKDIVKHMLLHKLGMSNKQKIYARKCYVKEIEAKVKNEFLQLNHIQGADSSKIKLGLFTKDNDQLVAVMTFAGKNLAKGTINLKDTDWELNRFATDINYQVVGGAGKILEYFKRNYKWTSIFSYADRRWSTGNLYYKLGFELISITKPNYWYFKNYNRIYRFSLRKQPDEPKDIPEWKLRHDQGYYRIWDCGNLKFNMINNDIH